MEQKTKRSQGQPAQPANLTGIPAQMKWEMEQRSGLSFDDVRVHYNSALPARIGAWAYTQGTQVHIGPGQERHLPHELGHVVQQKLGIVQEGQALAAGGKLNTDPALERQADRFARGDEPIRRIWPARVRPNSPAGAWIQRKAAVGVTLSTVDQQRFEASELKVDTLTFGGREDPHLPIFRLDTKGGLELKGNSDTQGAHTLADSFVKKYQKDVLKGQTLKQAIQFYTDLVAALETWETGEKATDLSGFDPVLALPLALRGKANSVNQARARGKDYVRALSDRRVLCLQKIDLLKRSLAGMQGGVSARPMTVWNVFFKHLVSLYNQAYALGSLSTVGVGTPGKGEAGGLYALKLQKLQRHFSVLKNETSTGTTDKLLDGEFLDHFAMPDRPATPGADPNFLRNSLISTHQKMLGDILKNRNRNDSNGRHVYGDLLRFSTQSPNTLHIRPPQTCPEASGQDGQERETADSEQNTGPDYNSVFGILDQAFRALSDLQGGALLFSLEDTEMHILPVEQLGDATLSDEEKIQTLESSGQPIETNGIFGDLDDQTFNTKMEILAAFTALLPIALPGWRNVEVFPGISIYLVTPLQEKNEEAFLSIAKINAQFLAQRLYPNNLPDPEEEEMSIPLQREPKEIDNEKYEEGL